MRVKWRIRFGYQTKETAEELMFGLYFLKLITVNYPIVVIAFVPLTIVDDPIVGHFDTFGINILGFYAVIEKVTIKKAVK